MKFVLTIELGNDGMTEPRHVASALREVALAVARLTNAEIDAGPFPAMKIRDWNGNTCGSCQFVEEES